MHIIDDLLEMVEVAGDGTGCLALLGRFLQPLEPSMLFLADASGKVMAADALGTGASIETAPHLAKTVAESLGTEEACQIEISTHRGPQIAFGVRIPLGGSWELLGGTVRSIDTAPEELRQRQSTLTLCSQLARSAIVINAQKKKVHTENKHLRAEHTTLRAAHTEAVIAAIKEKEEKAALEAQRAALEQFLHSAQKSSRSKSEFLASMSHEIRTPMTSLLGFTDLLLQSLTKPEEIEAAQVIKRNGEFLLEIVNDILDISKIEAGKLEVERISCSPHEIVEDVRGLLSPRAKAKGLSFQTVYEGPIPQTVHTDPTRVKQVLLNLIGNAIKFTETGEVRVISRLLGRDEAETKLQFDVIDTGIGMTEEQVEQLFSPFVQADRSITRKYGGTGLGLAISKRLAELLGGDITVRSLAGQGSTFTATVDTGSLSGVQMRESPPQTIVSTPAGRRESQKPKRKLHGRILLAEDSPDNQRLVLRILRHAGAEVDVADNGQTAVTMALAGDHSQGENAGGRYDVILMDLDMPVMDGLEATRQLRDRGYGGTIIAFTAHVTQNHVEQCLKAGSNAFIGKPIRPLEMIETIRQFLT